MAENKNKLDEIVDDNPLEYKTRRQWTPEEDKILLEKERTRQFCPNFSMIELHYHCGRDIVIYKN